MRPLRILLVVQRYGADFSGGAEAAARGVAEGLAGRGHPVSVATTTAKSYVDWANFYEEGEEELNGVRILRFAVDRPRDEALFTEVSGRVVTPRLASPPPFLQRTWQQLQGPDSSALLRYLEDRSADFDVVLFFTYLYWPAVAGVPIAARRAPTILQTLAHDEPFFHLPVQDDHLYAAHRILCLVPEEADLIRSRLGGDVKIGVTGVGTDVHAGGEGARFRERWGLGTDPFLLYVGRVDLSKGVRELVEQFRTYKERNRNDLRLVLLGEQVFEFEPHPDITCTGFVSVQERSDAIAACMALMNPSYYESFSMVLTEAWAHARPVLVNARCAVLREQVRRSAGGLAYDGFAELETAIEVLAADEAARKAMGTWGRQYLEQHYTWDRVLDRYEAQLHLTVSAAGGGLS